MQPNDTSSGSSYQEIRDLLAEIARRQARFQEETEEWARENKEQNRVLREGLAETDRILRERIQETETILRKSGEDVDRRQRATAQEIEELKKQLGGLGQKFGGFTEGMAFPSMSKILRERFGATFVAPRVRSYRNGQAMEVDVLAYSNSGTNEAFVVEVKSHLREEGLQQMLKTLREFRSFFPEHRDKKLYGILAVVDAPPDLQQRVLREGIYLARIHDGVFEVQVPEDFHARAF